MVCRGRAALLEPRTPRLTAHGSPAARHTALPHGHCICSDPCSDCRLAHWPLRPPVKVIKLELIQLTLPGVGYSAARNARLT